MWQRLVASAVFCVFTGACGDDSSNAPGPSGPNYAGSCNHEAQAVCDEYAIDLATSATPGQCTGAGGVWAATQCPLVGRTASCATGTPATRMFAYSEAAAASLMSSCPMGKFKAIEGPAPTGGTGGAGGTGGEPMMMPDAGMMGPDAMMLDAAVPDSGI